jgi:hypothetical protein
MTLEQLGSGVHWLATELYSPENFSRRVLRMIELFPVDGPPALGAAHRPIVAEATLACHRFLFGAADSAAAMRRILAALRDKPSARESALFAVFVWAQRRYQLKQWQSKPVHTQLPPLLQLTRTHPGAAEKRSLQVVR